MHISENKYKVMKIQQQISVYLSSFVIGRNSTNLKSCRCLHFHPVIGRCGVLLHKHPTLTPLQTMHSATHPSKTRIQKSTLDRRKEQMMHVEKKKCSQTN